MAGSYQHCCGDGDQFRFDLIENMGDAHEACEMMFSMVNWLAFQLSGEDHPPSYFVKKAEEAYYESRRSCAGNEPPQD